MISELDVELFLRDFHQKLKIFEIIFRDNRGKNQQALLDLEISPAARRKVIEGLEKKDYAEGPLDDRLYGLGSMWIFGKNVKNKEVYIKISMGRPDSQVICISFHAAEKPMSYPLKPTEK
jgi:hypothetical protein